uniref:Acetyltransferase n=1 Tax=Panagrellus redivivus TaxID=6233 RepID=A0A7E4WAX3_PANRE
MGIISTAVSNGVFRFEAEGCVSSQLDGDNPQGHPSVVDLSFSIHPTIRPTYPSRQWMETKTHCLRLAPARAEDAHCLGSVCAKRAMEIGEWN